MSRPWTFQLPTSVRFGQGLLRNLGEMVGPLGQRALLVGYADAGPLAKHYAAAQESLRRSGLEVVPFLAVGTEPGPEIVDQGVEQIDRHQATVVVGLGGGSVLDTAKAMAWAAVDRGPFASRLADTETAAHDLKPLPCVALPTTAGTGSEISDVVVFSKESQQQPSQPIKASFFGPSLRPTLAVIDPELALGLPPALTAASGADALAHAVESCLSRRSHPMAMLYASEAVRLILEHLPRAVRHPDTHEPREALALAAMLAGVAFSTAGVVVSHAMAHALGSLLGVPHGQAVAVATPVQLRWNLPRASEPLAALASHCGIGGATGAEKAENLVVAIENLLASVGLPRKIARPPDAPADLADRLAANALLSTRAPVMFNPVKTDTAALRNLFLSVLD